MKILFKKILVIIEIYNNKYADKINPKLGKVLNTALLHTERFIILKFYV
jgi:hypothetical protein